MNCSLLCNPNGLVAQLLQLITDDALLPEEVQYISNVNF